MTFRPRFGYVASPPETLAAQARPSFSFTTPPPAYDSGVVSELVVQAFDDCVQRTLTKLMRKRIVLARTPEARASLPWPALPSSRFARWQWLESIGKLGDETQGTEPYAFLDLLNTRGWCAESWMPYEAPDGSAIASDLDHAPPIAAYQHARDQQGQLKSHVLDDTVATRLAIAHDLGVALPIACDKRFASDGGIPNDPDYVWDFDESSEVAGWHMIEAQSYDERGVWCPNTWDKTFGCNGYVRIGWTTLQNPARARSPLAIDWSAMTSEELQAVLASKGRPS